MQLYQSLGTKSSNTDIAPDKEEIKQFLEGKGRAAAKHNPKVGWIEKVKTEIRTVQQQKNSSMTVKDIRDVFRKVSNLKSPEFGANSRFFELDAFITYMKE